MSECKVLWKSVLSELEVLLTTVSFDMWFKDLEPYTVENDKLVLIAPLNSFKSINKNYKDQIKKAIENSGAKISGIEIITKAETDNYTLSDEEEKEEDDSDTVNMFDPGYTFDSFVVGDSNSIAYAAAEAVAKAPGAFHNPLFIYGGVGLGKTHIMHAIANYILSQNKKAKILYVTAEQFVNDYIDSLKNNKDNELNKQFRLKYRSVDVLMMDDVQFLSGKTSTQEALFHTFNDLYQFRKQIVLTSDRHPRELTFLQDRLKSRFQSGLTVDITKPSIETRIAILQKKAYAKKYDISQKAVFFIAENITSNIRELEGALSKVVFYCSLSGRSSDDLEAVKDALKDCIDVSSHVISMDSIADATCAYYGIKKSDIIGKRKNKLISNARQMAIYLINDMLGVPLSSIGEFFGGRDHTTIMYARDKMTDLSKTDHLIQAQINDIKSMLEKK